MAEKQTLDRIGFLGAGPMANLALNIAGHGKEKGWPVTLYNYDETELTKFKVSHSTNMSNTQEHIDTTTDLGELVKQVGKTGVYWLMIKAGKPTDKTITDLAELLDPGAIIIEGGNSHYKDTQKRMERLNKKGIQYIGTGVSGGEQGALIGPSCMPGGNHEAWDRVKPLFEHIAAKYGGEPCAKWIGNGGAGHFVKMVHNGIEYADMQLIAEAYDIMRHAGMTAPEIGTVFEKWNKGNLKSYLVEITADILKQHDPRGGDAYLVDKILDKAGMKGTGTWTTMAALENESGVVPIPTIAAAVNARAMSSYSDLRENLAKAFPAGEHKFTGDKETLVNDLEKALYASKIMAYAQGIHLIQTAAGIKGNKFGNIDIGEVVKLWRNGCIIRADLLKDIANVYSQNPNIKHLLLADSLQGRIADGLQSLDNVLHSGINLGVPMPAFSASRDYVTSFGSKQLPVNLTQGQRDYFGAHKYKRTDEPRGNEFHTSWELESNKRTEERK
ncbi:NADP-dependent phosphogluconate dehydrogenase [Candidatus Woesearchaeota archaeon]|nr:NADP-dependent phosphogluconate dehydrogenase [Candidatus Woesearchaeota archaeon]